MTGSSLSRTNLLISARSFLIVSVSCETTLSLLKLCLVPLSSVPLLLYLAFIEAQVPLALSDEGLERRDFPVDLDQFGV